MREIGLIWMSVGNSYFNEEKVQKLIEFAEKRFEKIIVMSPDIPAEHTFRALGYKENESKKRAKYDSNLLKNRAKRKIDLLKGKDKFDILEWGKNVSVDKFYKEKYKEIYELYEKDSKFKIDARNTTKKVLEGKYRTPENIEKAIDEAVFYLIKELALVISLPKKYNKKVTYLYHREWPIFEKLIKGYYDNKKRENLSFMLTGID
jgi:tRNA-dependent cyclodipeptide synthase